MAIYCCHLEKLDDNTTLTQKPESIFKWMQAFISSTNVPPKINLVHESDKIGYVQYIFSPL